jgi:hypothetical protein
MFWNVHADGSRMALKTVLPEPLDPRDLASLSDEACKYFRDCKYIQDQEEFLPEWSARNVGLGTPQKVRVRFKRMRGAP